MKKSNLAHNLSSLRQAKGLSQEKAAEALGCNLRTLQRFEEGREGRKGPPIELLLKMRRCYRCEISDLIREEDLLGETDWNAPTERI